ncbi:MAG: hypothetical protein MZU79_09170 [Anaerotruncus sp.]|nr:hypothetical protein [Anaerotruncus sp.]
MLPSPGIPRAHHEHGRVTQDQGRRGEDHARHCQKLMDEDPVLKVYRDEQTGEFILSGLGQLHIEIAVDRLKRRFGVDVELKTPKVPYKETITGVRQRSRASTRSRPAATASTGTAGSRWSPSSGARGSSSSTPSWAGSSPRPISRAVEKGVDRGHAERPPHRKPGGGREGHPRLRLLPRGGLFGNGVQDRRLARLQEGHGGVPAHPAGTHHEHRGRDAEETMGDVMGDLNNRRAKIEG